MQEQIDHPHDSERNKDNLENKQGYSVFRIPVVGVQTCRPRSESCRRLPESHSATATPAWYHWLVGRKSAQEVPLSIFLELNHEVRSVVQLALLALPTIHLPRKHPNPSSSFRLAYFLSSGCSSNDQACLISLSTQPRLRGTTNGPTRTETDHRTRARSEEETTKAPQRRHPRDFPEWPHGHGYSSHQAPPGCR